MTGLLPLKGQLTTNLKRSQLQRLATLIGTTLTGPKAELATGIADATESAWRPLAQPSLKLLDEVRVLSIDMGIRNLAFAFLTCKLSVTPTNSLLIGKPTLANWRRIDLTEKNSHSLVDRVTDIKPDKHDAPTTVSIQSFEPYDMAHQAYNFVKSCLDMRPTHILIERQRFRSGGHSAVQEWSLRVGMLEAMLHATFRTMQSEGSLPGLTVESVLPMRVNKFWFRDLEVPSTGSLAKQAKIELVQQILRKKDKVTAELTLDPSLIDAVVSFTTKTVKNRTKKLGQSGKVKLDDMSDSLLQGLAWLHWQRNRSILLHHGFDHLDLGLTL